MRVAFFPCVYHEIDGVASTSRHFEAFARRRDCPFLIVHAGPRNEISTVGPVTHVQLRRGPVKFPLDRAHKYDLLFLRHLWKLESAGSQLSAAADSDHRAERRGHARGPDCLQARDPPCRVMANQFASVCPKPRGRSDVVHPQSGEQPTCSMLWKGWLSVLPRVSTRSPGFSSRPTRRSSRYLRGAPAGPVS